MYKGEEVEVIEMSHGLLKNVYVFYDVNHIKH